ncbi:hypothetical protein E4T56_gene9737 [Termitomyces sp. T112]|nr:hypothetical protein E4T56_gene9737 [Termitomyces sp. T112]KAH0584458.1 hypothetical protein H2248_009995 [Termitomyces sp. 'cryptogamus']
MRWFSFTVFAATLVILASFSVAVPTRTTNDVVPRALKQYKMKRPVQRDVSDEGSEERQDDYQHHHPKPSHYWNPTTTWQWWQGTETSV